MYENRETTRETIEITSMKKAAKLSILNVRVRNGIFVLKLKFKGMSLKNNNLYIIIMLKSPLEIIANEFDNLFDALGKKYVNIEDIAPSKYNITQTAKLNDK